MNSSKTFSQPTFLQIAQLGHPVIRKKTNKVPDVLSSEIQKLIDDMIATVMDYPGVGIAATQVYKSLRLFIISSHPNPRYPDAPLMEPTAMINPKIISTSKEKVKGWEGCLSIPGIRGMVPRFTSVKAEYTTREGKKVQKEFKDFIARVFQHEYDHIEGIVFLDQLESTKDIITDKEYQKIIAKKTQEKPLKKGL